MESILIIPARGGSTRVPNKNLQLINGRPLIYYSIQAAKLAGIKNIIVSTDSKDIATFAESQGIKVPFLRPDNLSTATSTSISVIIHVLCKIKEENKYKPDIIIFKPPTNPFLTPSSIIKMIELKQTNRSVDSVLSIFRPRVSALNYVNFSKDKKTIETQIYDIEGTKLYDIERSQDRPISFASSPACKITETKYFVEKYLNNKTNPESCSGPTFNYKNSFGYEIKEKEAHDIDTINDLRMSELLLNSEEMQLQRDFYNHIY